jgi:hypothetical protein
VSQCPPIFKTGRIFRIAFLAVGLPLSVFAMFISEQRPPTLVAVLFVLVLMLGLWSWLHDRAQYRQLEKMQMDRAALDAPAFAEAFRDIKNGPATAIAVRDLLQEHVEVNLSGLRPEDSVDALRDYFDPVFFDELAEKLGFRAPADSPEFSAMVTPLKTVRDLVEVVASRLE